MSKYREMFNRSEFRRIFDDIDARLTALEGAKVTEVFTDTTHGFAGNMASVKDSATVAEASDEEVAIARVRNCVTEKYTPSHIDVAIAVAALDRVTQERDDAQSQVVLREAFHERESMRINARIADLEAQLAARTDAKPLGWVNVYPDSSRAIFDEDAAKESASRYKRMKRIAVPVYEHPPAAASEPPKVVGACVVWKEGEVARSWMPTEDRSQKQCESLAVQNAILDAGTAHRFVLGEEITP